MWNMFIYCDLIYSFANSCFYFLFIAKMVMPVNKPKIVKKRKKRFIRHQSDRYLRVKVSLSVVHNIT